MTEYTEFTNGRLSMHMNFGNSGVRVDLFDISCKGHELHGKTIARQVDTRKTKMKGWGKGEVIFFLSSHEKTPTFKTIDEFIANYKLPPLKSKT